MSKYGDKAKALPVRSINNLDKQIGWYTSNPKEPKCVWLEKYGMTIMLEDILLCDPNLELI